MVCSKLGTRLQISETLKNKNIIPPSRKGSKMPVTFIESTKKRMKGNKYNEGFKNFMGHRHSIETKETIGRKTSSRKGINAGNWKGGITPLHNFIRNLKESKAWRTSIFERDNYMCVQCNNSGYLEAHHIKPFAFLLQELLKERPKLIDYITADSLNIIINHHPFWDINNGVTLCEKCHNITKKSSVMGNLRMED